MEVGERPYYLRPIVSNTSLGHRNVFYDSTSSSDTCSSILMTSNSNSTSSISSEETCFICFSYPSKTSFNWVCFFINIVSV